METVSEGSFLIIFFLASPAIIWYALSKGYGHHYEPETPNVSDDDESNPTSIYYEHHENVHYSEFQKSLTRSIKSLLSD